jgi:hypothetical protein
MSASIVASAGLTAYALAVAQRILAGAGSVLVGKSVAGPSGGEVQARVVYIPPGALTHARQPVD